MIRTFARKPRDVEKLKLVIREWCRVWKNAERSKNLRTAALARRVVERWRKDLPPQCQK
jgi:hypothetical protein